MAKSKILGKLKGIIASAKEMSRNNRKYTEPFWDSIFNSDLFIEGLNNRVYFGELWHPDSDYEYGQIHPGDRAAVVLTDVEKKGLDYYGTFDILPTEAGRVLKNLYDVGCKLGVSSRGYADNDRTVFDENTDYEFITFDLVAFPGVKSCRLNLVGEVAESFSQRKPTAATKIKIMESLNESVKNGEYADIIKKAVNHIVDEDLTKVCSADELRYHCPAVFDDVDDDDSKFIADNMITVDNEGTPHHNNKRVYISDSIDIKPGDKYLANSIYWSNKRNSYVVVGGLTKLQK